MSDLAKLLAFIGRKPEEPCTILTQKAGGTGLEVEWTTVADAPAVAAKHDGLASVWFGVQPVRVSAGRGKGNDVTGVRTLYADLDDKNMTRDQAMSVIGHLSNTLGVGCGAMVVSGGGVQPYWPIQEVDPIGGADLLLWWRERVIACAAEEGVSVDTGVYDLARILRVPGPRNMKPIYGERGAKTGLIYTGAGWRISHDELLAAMTRTPAAGKTRASRPSGGSGGFSAREESSEDRVFTPEQFQAYLEVNPGKVKQARNTPHGAGFNTALNEACFDIAAGVPELLSEEQAWDIAYGIVEAQFPGGPDGNDIATIRSGFSQARWTARRPTEAEALNPFGLYADTEKIKAKQGGIRAAAPSSRSVVATRATVIAADAAVAAVEAAVPHAMEALGYELGGVDADGKPRPEADCYLPEEFWAARPLFQHLRRAAQSAMASPEGVLLAGLALVASRVMPNVKLPAPIGSPASLNHMFVLCGDSADGKSTCRKVAKGAIRLDDGVAPWHSFGPSSGQGVAGQFQRLVKQQGQPAFLERTRWAAFAHVEESDTMQALLANKTNTIGAVLRQGAFGEELSYGNIGETQTNLPEHSYRLIFWMCMQPELSDWLLGTGAGGLPQRFVWGCVRDPRIVDCEHPGVFPVRVAIETMPDPVTMRPRDELVMTCTEEIRLEIREAARQRKIHGNLAGEEFDGHSVLNRFKLAGHIALADGRLAITADDWDLARMVMATSSASLRWVRAVVAWAGAEEARKVALGRGKSRVIEESVVRVHDESLFKTKCRERILLVLKNRPGILRKELKDSISPRQLDFFDEVINELVEVEVIRFEERSSSSAWFLK